MTPARRLHLVLLGVALAAAPAGATPRPRVSIKLIETPGGKIGLRGTVSRGGRLRRALGRAPAPALTFEVLADGTVRTEPGDKRTLGRDASVQHQLVFQNGRKGIFVAAGKGALEDHRNVTSIDILPMRWKNGAITFEGEAVTRIRGKTVRVEKLSVHDNYATRSVERHRWFPKLWHNIWGLTFRTETQRPGRGLEVRRFDKFWQPVSD